jgi:DNA-binding GntR family transcriptional regulator
VHGVILKNDSLSQQAYDRVEGMIVTTQLAPGTRTTLSELETLSGFGRTPVHDAVKRLATVRLILIQPRSGLRIAPLDLDEERLLLPVRIEMEAIACRLAAQRAGADQLATLTDLADRLRSGGDTMTLEEFNRIDSILNATILAASGEMMLENTLLPLQTLYRRSGWLFHKHLPSHTAMVDLVASHLELATSIIDKDSVGAEHQARAMLSKLYTTLQDLQKLDLP